VTLLVRRPACGSGHRAPPDRLVPEKTIAVVDLEPGGSPRIVAQVDLDGDDSVAGAVFSVRLDEQFDVGGPIGRRSTVALVGDVCARGGSAGRDICV
jgi:hypothetical protein